MVDLFEAARAYAENATAVNTRNLQHAAKLWAFESLADPWASSERIKASLSGQGCPKDRAAAECIMSIIREDIDKTPAPMAWTKEKPKVEGWYWHRTLPGYVHEPLGVLFDKGVLRYWNVVEESFCDLPPGQWAGPMLEPADPTDSKP